MLSEKLMNSVQAAPNFLLRHLIDPIGNQAHLINVWQKRLMFFTQRFGYIPHGHYPLGVFLRELLGDRSTDFRYFAANLSHQVIQSNYADGRIEAFNDGHAPHMIGTHQ